jgi:hypothetical protein
MSTKTAVTSVTTEEKGMETTATVSTATSAVETVVYIGPSITNVVEEGAIFNNGLTQALLDEIKRKPFLKGLIIPINQLAKAKADLRVNNSAIHTLYTKTAE